MMFRSLKHIACTGLMTALCLSTSQIDAVLVSAKALGMAGTGIAYPQDSLAAAYNPAGPAEIEQRFDIGIGWLRDTSKTRVSGNIAPVAGVNGSYKAMRTRDSYSPDFGINKRYCVNTCNRSFDIAYGVVAYNRNFQKTNYTKVIPLIGTSKPGLEVLNETISPYIALKITPCLSFGVSANWQILRLSVKGLQNFDNSARSLYPHHVTNKGYNWSNGLGYTLGLKWDVFNCLSVGVTYQPKTYMSRLKKYKGFVAEKGKLDIPRKLGLGFAFKPFNCLTLTFDLEHIQWTKIKALSNKLDLAIKTGSNNGSGFGFRNQLYYRFGVNWWVNSCWELRAGFRSVRAPIVASQTAINLLSCDTVEKIFTVGTTYHWDCVNEFTAYYGYGFNHKINGRNSIPAPLGYGEIDIQENKWVIGVSWGHRF